VYILNFISSITIVVPFRNIMLHNVIYNDITGLHTFNPAIITAVNISVHSYQITDTSINNERIIHAY